MDAEENYSTDAILYGVYNTVPTPQFPFHAILDSEVKTRANANTSIFENVQTGSEAHQASYTVGNGECLPEGKAAGA
jgi:hypothetical protein